jgi:DNA-binding CsgD family transcriptional regulator
MVFLVPVSLGVGWWAAVGGVWLGGGVEPARLTGRLSERDVLDRFVADVRAGEGRALVVRGEPGVGKTVLLDYLAGRASGCLVARAAGVQSEMELAFAGLHQLCAPMLDHAESLPGPQREALRTAFGLSAGPVPDRFLVGLAVLGLLSETAGERPLVCVVDDLQWLDHASAQALGFAARRLAADPVGLVFAARVPGQDVTGLPELVVEGLAENDARSLLESVLTGVAGPLDARVRDRIIADTHGNPLALLELTRGLAPAQLTGGFGVREAVPLDGRIEESFRRQLEALPAQTRRLVQLAAADPSGDPVLVWRAAGRLAIGAGAAGPAVEAGLAEFGARVRFRHPLVRSAAYRSASVQTRQELHGALAEATDPAADPDRRAWHRAEAAPGPDEQVAAELEQCAGRAQRRGGLAAAAAFLERSAGLTLDPARRAQRALAAAQASHQAGALDAALGLLAMAQAGPLDELSSARVDLLRAQVVFASRHGRDAPPLMLSAARRLEALDVGLARETYLEAFTAALFVGRLSPAVGDVAAAARMAPAPLVPGRAPDLLLDGLAVLVTEGYSAGTPALRRALLAFRAQDAQEGLSWLWLAGRAAMAVWDDETWHILASRHVKLARESGALSELPLAVRSRILLHAHAGELAEGAALIAEAQAVADATGSQLAPYGATGIAAWRGREAEAVELIQANMDGVTSRGEGRGVTSQYSAALLYNGLGHYDKALAAAERVCEYDDIGVLGWSLAELIEAAVRTGQPARASDALERLCETTRASGTDWALGAEARSRALLSEGEAAEKLYREAIERLDRTRMRPAAARAHLLYGEWLRRGNRRKDARAELRTAYEQLTAMGIEAFAERARRELLATGDTVRKRTVETATELTAQEACIARLAVDGRTNAEIGAQLFLSTRTVEWHLGKVYGKLGAGSRRDLRRALGSREHPG